MKMTDSKKLDQIITMLGDIVGIFGKRFDTVEDKLDEHTKLHGGHTRDLNMLKNDSKNSLDKRKQLEVKVETMQREIISLKT